MMTKMQFACEIMKIYGEISKVREMMKSYAYSVLEDWGSIPNKKELIDTMINSMSKTMFRQLGVLENERAKDIIIRLIDSSCCGWFNINYAISDLEELGIEFKED